MKQILFTLLVFCSVAMVSCRKSNVNIDIKQYDNDQILTYISANKLTGFQRDLSSGDTTGIYYKILTPGTGATLDFPTKALLVFTLTTFDGQTTFASDTIGNHVYNYVGHLTQNNLPVGVELALVNIMKKKGGRIQLLIPSRLAFGASGSGTGSSSSGQRINGNQCVEMYVNVIDDGLVTDPATNKQVNGQNLYDDISVKKYIAANSLTGYLPTGSGLYYKITQAGTGAAITPTSIVNIQYTSILFDGVLTTDAANDATGTGTPVDLSTDIRKGFIEGLQLVTPGAKLSLIMPSRLAFGNTVYSDVNAPVFSCLRYEMNVISIQ